jgi:hypothetical protein
MKPTSSQWILPFAVQLIPGTLMIIGMFFVPESPRWLAQHKSRDIAAHTLCKLRGLPEDHPYLQEELTHIMDTVNEQLESPHDQGLISQLKELRVPSNRRRIFVGVTIFIFVSRAKLQIVRAKSYQMALGLSSVPFFFFPSFFSF